MHENDFELRDFENLKQTSIKLMKTGLNRKLCLRFLSSEKLKNEKLQQR